MKTRKFRPAVGIPCDHRIVGPHPSQTVGDKYIDAVRLAADCTPVLLPSLGTPLTPAEIFDVIDGILITGAPSNVHPSHYGGSPPSENMALDERRDATTLPLIQAAIETGVPLFCICRGHQELNVALGGTLHPFLHKVEGRIDHREDKAKPLEVQYGPAHEVTLEPGGYLHRLLGHASITVNSVHGQGVHRLADGLTVEAKAPDGTIEAMRVTDARSYALSVQWHPEWKVMEHPLNRRIFEDFGAQLRRDASRQSA